MISTADLVDKYTILLLKQEHGVPVHENLDRYKDSLKDVDCRYLYWINKVMWNVEEQMSVESDLKKVLIL